MYLAPDLKGATSRSYHDSLGKPVFAAFLMPEEEEEEERKPEMPDPMPEEDPRPGDIRSARRGRSRLNKEPEDMGSSLEGKRKRTKLKYTS